MAAMPGTLTIAFDEKSHATLERLAGRLEGIAELVAARTEVESELLAVNLRLEVLVKRLLEAQGMNGSFYAVDVGDVVPWSPIPDKAWATTDQSAEGDGH
jgi:hypothetical protein